MQIHRIYAVFLRHWYALLSNPDRWLEIFYWPIFDLLLWGIAGTAVQSEVAAQGTNQLGVLMILGTLLWLILQRTQHEMNMSFLTDMWDGNLTNLFISPLSFAEWFLAVVLISFVKMLLSFSFAVGVAMALYQITIFTAGVQLLPSMLLLLLFGWSLSAVSIAALFVFGSKAQTFSWFLIVFVAPFSAIYYSVAALPDWARVFGKILPTSYAFEAARQVFTTGRFDRIPVLVGYGLVLSYLVAAFFILRASIYFSLQRGLFKNK